MDELESIVEHCHHSDTDDSKAKKFSSGVLPLVDEYEKMGELNSSNYPLDSVFSLVLGGNSFAIALSDESASNLLSTVMKKATGGIVFRCSLL